MIPSIIGISSGIFLIFLFHWMKQVDKSLLYGLILTGIGFIYVGFTWTNLEALVICCIQAVLFLLLAWVGIKKSGYLLAMGFFLHGTWDLLFAPFAPTHLIPPGYDLFCLTIDFTMGLYLFYYAFQNNRRLSALK
ncbi:DUF6010 family protein [Flavihumibacter sp. UBA7668]|uniref:DUF6010 family protein n=1 Tax=Flavihumibacter sp. UBA7668 TaxID=1946542 RepID=UPI0025B7F71D|nr:DUF6010 family protein [Flavihumibacter sp. UBA7668]